MATDKRGATTERLRLPSIRVDSTQDTSRTSTYVMSTQTCHMIFNDHQTQQDVKEEIQMICQQLNIDPEFLPLKDLNSFKDPNISDRVQQVRFNHYNNRRMKYLKLLDNQIFGRADTEMSFISPRGVTVPIKIPESLRGGKSLQIKTTNLHLLGQKSDMGKSARNLNLSKKQTSQVLAQTPVNPSPTSKKANLMRPLKTAQADSLADYQSVIDSLQVPLRVPLDLSYSQGNRALAKVIFKTECQQKVKEASIKRQMDIEHTKAQIIARNNKNEKRYAKELKERDTLLKQKNEEWETKRNMVVKQKKLINQERNQELQDQYIKIMEADEKLKREKEKKRKEHEEELFQLDLQRAYDAEYAQGEIKEKKLRDIKEVETKIKDYEEKSKLKQETKLKTVEEIKQKINAKNKEWEEKKFIAVNKDNLITPDDFNTFVPKKLQKSKAVVVVENIQPGVIVNKPDYLSNFTVDKDKIEFYKQAQVLKDKIQKSEKIRETSLKQKKKELAEKLETKFQTAKNNKKAIQQDFKEKVREIGEKDQKRQKGVQEVKEAVKKDKDTTKELRSLKKQDQVENYQRGQAMQKLYKQKLVEKMLYKYEKADAFKENVEKLKNKIQKAAVEKFKREAKQMNAEYEQKMQAMKKDMEDY